MTHADTLPIDATAPAHPAQVARRSLVIGLTAFLTVVDLFATQAILPALTQAYGVTPAAMGFAVNASTMGMAIAGLSVALFGRRIDRRRGVLVSLSVLAIPTSLLAIAPDLTAFMVLRVLQGLCMASAFTLTLAYLDEQCSAADTGSAFAAYIAGNVASNLIGRFISAGVADHFGLAWNFYLFALLNLAGAILVWFTMERTPPMEPAAPAAAAQPPASPGAALLVHLRNPALLASFAIGFCILFAFIGTFTYVNFVLVRPPLSLGMMQIGFVYFVFLPSIVTTLVAGRATERASRSGARSPARRPGCLCCWRRCCPSFSPAWCWWGSERSSPRLPRPALSDAPPPPTAARRAACISQATSPAVSSAARCSARCSIAGAGLPASAASGSRSWRRRC